MDSIHDAKTEKYSRVTKRHTQQIQDSKCVKARGRKARERAVVTCLKVLQRGSSTAQVRSWSMYCTVGSAL